MRDHRKHVKIEQRSKPGDHASFIDVTTEALQDDYVLTGRQVFQQCVHLLQSWVASCVNELSNSNKKQFYLDIEQAV
jgi:hypothetical protein